MEVYEGEVPTSMQELITLGGVARKTANIVLSNAFNIHEGIAVDTHVKRLAFRMGLTKIQIPHALKKTSCHCIPMKHGAISTTVSSFSDARSAPHENRNVTSVNLKTSAEKGS